MNFRPELAALVMEGRKTVTRRLVSNNPRSPWFVDGCSLKVDRSYAVCPGRGKNAIGRVVVTSVELVPLDPICAEDARAEGFEDAKAFWAAFNAINKNVDPGEWVWRIAFKVVNEDDLLLWEGAPEASSLVGESGGRG
jgi:hypothetical protein